MTFSIVIPSYNGSAFIDQALRSALDQTRRPDEIVLSDDNSNDRTLEIAERYADKVRIVRNPNGPSGFVNGWNHAIDQASSDFVVLLHQDDLLYPTFLEEAEAVLKKYPEVKHLFAACDYIDETGNILQKPDYCNGETVLYDWTAYVKAYQQIGHPHIHRCPGVVTHRDILQRCRYNPEAGHIADDDFFFRVGRFTPVAGILKPLAAYRHHVGSETGHLTNTQLESRLARDYLFQLRQWTTTDRLPKEPFVYEYLRREAQKHVFREVIQCRAFATAKTDRDTAQAHRKEFSDYCRFTLRQRFLLGLSLVVGRRGTRLLIDSKHRWNRRKTKKTVQGVTA